MPCKAMARALSVLLYCSRNILMYVPNLTQMPTMDSRMKDEEYLATSFYSTTNWNLLIPCSLLYSLSPYP
jgi:hypothetical protein